MYDHCNMAVKGFIILRRIGFRTHYSCNGICFYQLTHFHQFTVIFKSIFIKEIDHETCILIFFNLQIGSLYTFLCIFLNSRRIALSLIITLHWMGAGAFKIISLSDHNMGPNSNLVKASATSLTVAVLHLLTLDSEFDTLSS